MMSFPPSSREECKVCKQLIIQAGKTEKELASVTVFMKEITGHVISP